MYEELKKAVEAEDYESAHEILNRSIAGGDAVFEDANSCILAATVYLYFGEDELAFPLISMGLKKDYKNSELYLLLGSYYCNKNVYQARLCYEQALFYSEEPEDREVISSYLEDVREAAADLKPVSIVILTFNRLEENQHCIDSIRQTLAPGSYELIVVDNHSTDGTAEWLREQKDMKVIQNEENLGFPAGCNQGIQAAMENNDIFLLNSDTVLLPGSLFWLRMGLYEDEKVGATGSVSNHAGNEQQIDIDLSPESMLMVNMPMEHPYEYKPWLIGFAMLIKRKAMDEVGLLDERFSPGNFEDNDYGVRLNLAGYRTVLCHNSFIFHSGGYTEKKNAEIWTAAFENNKAKFKEKWGFEPSYFSWVRKELVDLIDAPKDAAIQVLELGCALGVTLNRIQYQWPNASVHGIEYNQDVVNIGINYVDILQGDLDVMEFPYEDAQFDYIVCGDVLEHLRDTEAVIRRLRRYLKPEGKMIVSLPNLMHVSVLRPLFLQGDFEYEDAGILDRTHLRFFTAHSIMKMMGRSGYRISHMAGVDGRKTEEEETFIRKMCDMFPEIDEMWLRAYQYIFTATIRQEE